MNEVRIFPILGVGQVNEGDDLVTLFLDALTAGGHTLQHHDLVTVTSKIVSKSEGQVVAFDGTDEHKDQLISQQSKRVIRRRGPMRITETHHGFVNANAGIDLSNTAELARRTGVEVGVVVTDTFGRVWRTGVTDVALGSAGLKPILDLRGTLDAEGRVLEVTEVAIIDEIAGAANLVLGKSEGTPFAILRGLDESYFGEGSVKEDVIRPASNDLFR